jgi:hypothetical protein
MQNAMLYRLAQDRVVQLRREARNYHRSSEPHVSDHGKSLSSLAYWQARRWQRAY